MTIRLDHTIVPAKDKNASAEFFAEIFGLTVTLAPPRLWRGRSACQGENLARAGAFGCEGAGPVEPVATRRAGPSGPVDRART